MKIDERIISELKRYNSINKYITEQDAALPPPPSGDIPPPPGDLGAAPPDMTATPPPAPDTTTGTTAVDVANDPDVEKIGDEKKEDKEELEITDLVKSQKNAETKQEEYFDSLFKHLETLEGKLSEMDNIVNKLNDLETKIEKYRVKTPEERLELRSLDSGPFNQKLTDFFDDKQEDFEKTGKNEYILTQDEVQDYSPLEIKKSFRNFEQNPVSDYQNIK